ncbi:MAG: hypothetical protein LUC41_06890 [Clostridiales bacterium]|nr:hypothetical protein [Clostridiales bacterium]
MQSVNLNNPVEIRITGMKALSDALGPVGTARFMQQFEPGYGDYTKEKQFRDDPSLEEIDAILSQG